MTNKKFISVLAIPLLFTTIYTATPASAETTPTPSTTTNSEELAKDQKAVNKALKIVLEKTNQQIKSGKENIKVSQYVPEINQNVSMEFVTKDISTNTQTNTLQKNTISYAVAKPSGRKAYYGKMNAWGFTHVLRGDFVYGGGKVISATKEVQNTGLTYTHSSTSSIAKLDPSVWQIQSKSVHKWLGKVGSVTGLGYTSYVSVEVYGSGTSAVRNASFTTGA
ncbi:hypothetical protein [Macrococcus brunensis]|uniref:hypothetical protein n=1 Tax=Macrococcus brunensis TaxID=198483 RepID=UPI001EF0503F|nr:hypothetical protein [Macrococcus brunensis]ULG73154.1 hypothetical protein MGG12_11960 [Macrococcus brunensis]